MKQWQRFGKIGLLLLVLAGVCLPSAPVQAGQADMVQVGVQLTIENPDYFWKYPFWGRPMDSIRVYGLGKTVYISSQSAGETLLFDVPKGYKLKLALAFQSGGTTLKEMNYLTDWGASEANHSVSIRLTAPEPAPIQIKVSDLETLK